MKHLLVTNDFPPKVGGIQSYLWELWRRLPPDEVTVLTAPHESAVQWDAGQPFRIERTDQRVLLPTRRLVRHIDRLAAEVGAELVVLDPVLPLGLVGPHLSRPYAVVIHGAEVTVPGRLPGSRGLLRRALAGARMVVSAGGYPAAEAERAVGRSLPTVNVPPGVDVGRFRPLAGAERETTRKGFGLPTDGQVIVGVSRLVPRKGFDVLIRAAARLAQNRPAFTVAIAGTGRDRRRLQWISDRAGAPVRFLGRVPDDSLPALYGAADLFAMLCRSRWLGLEQEGFGIVFLEAAAAGVAQVAGASGGSAEAVADGVTGVVVNDPRDVGEVTAALARLLDDPVSRTRMGEAARRRAVEDFSYDALARRLAGALDGW